MQTIQQQGADFLSKGIGIVANTSLTRLMPSIVSDFSVVAGSVYGQAYFPTLEPGRRSDRTLSISGITTAETSDVSAQMLRDLLSGTGTSMIPLWDAGNANRLAAFYSFLQFADGRFVQLNMPMLVGGSIKPMNVGGSMYLNTTVNIAAKALRLFGGIVNQEEKLDYDKTSLSFLESSTFPILVRFNTASGWLQVGTFNSGTTFSGADFIPSANFLVTQISTSVNGIDNLSVTQYLPYALEAHAINPAPGSYMPGVAAENLVPGGHPLTMSNEILPYAYAYGLTKWVPDWTEYNILPSGMLSFGITDPSVFWQNGYVGEAPTCKVTVSVSGYFVDPVLSRAAIPLIQPSDTGFGNLEIFDASSGEALVAVSNVRFTNYAVEQDVQLLDGRPALASTFTFEYSNNL